MMNRVVLGVVALQRNAVRASARRELGRDVLHRQ